MLYSHFIWNEKYPNDLVELGEVIHHKNRNRLDDRVENYQKMTKTEHDGLHTPERVKGLRKALAGVPRSDHVKKKIGDANRGRPLTAKHKAILLKSHLGKKHSTATKEKMSLSQRRRREAEFLC